MSKKPVEPTPEELAAKHWEFIDNMTAESQSVSEAKWVVETIINHGADQLYEHYLDEIQPGKELDIGMNLAYVLCFMGD